MEVSAELRFIAAASLFALISISGFVGGYAAADNRGRDVGPIYWIAILVNAAAGAILIWLMVKL